MNYEVKVFLLFMTLQRWIDGKEIWVCKVLICGGYIKDTKKKKKMERLKFGSYTIRENLEYFIEAEI